MFQFSTKITNFRRRGIRHVCPQNAIDIFISKCA